MSGTTAAEAKTGLRAGWRGKRGAWEGVLRDAAGRVGSSRGSNSSAVQRSLSNQRSLKSPTSA